MDPLTWPMWLKLLVGWGPLGMGWVRAELRASARERAHHATRDMHDAAIAKLNEETRTAHEAAVTELNDAYARREQEKDAEHRAQLRELTDRFVKLIEKQAAPARVLADKVREKGGRDG